MKNFSVFLAVFILASITGKAEVIYLDPMPDAKYVSIENNLILGLEYPVSENELNNISITVTGSKSGLLRGTLKLSTDKKKIIWVKDEPFAGDETVTVSVNSGTAQISLYNSRTFSYRFQTERSRIKVGIESTLESELGKYHIPFQTDKDPDPPEVTVITSNNPSSGKILMGIFSITPSYLLMVENTGSLFYSEELLSNCYDFKRHEDGTYTYYSKLDDKFIQLDSSLNPIDSFYCRNGYSTDLHDIIFTPSHNVLLLSYDQQIINMSLVVPNGDTAAQVTGLVIQEIDPEGNVVFQWRSWDHFEITDALHLDLTAHSIDYVHGNALDYDTDENLLLSSRHLDEITKINRSNGEIIWRLGGKNNQFEFINDTLHFTYQHDIRRIANGNITLFDNGNFHSPQFSRAVEYHLDEINKKATLVWQYRHTPDIYGFAMGSVQRLENGNTLIGWGYTTPTLTEVTPSGTTSLEMKLPTGSLTYRVSKAQVDNLTNIPGNNSIADKFHLAQNYPNPFNPVTSIGFSIPVSGNVILKIYDMLGREIKTLLNHYKLSGNYNILFDASDLASGVYLYKLEAGSYTSSRKMVLIK